MNIPSELGGGWTASTRPSAKGVYMRVRDPKGQFASVSRASRELSVDAIEAAMRAAIASMAEQGVKIPKLPDYNGSFVSVMFTGQEPLLLALTRADGIARHLKELTTDPGVARAFQLLYTQIADTIRGIAEEVLEQVVYGGTTERYRGHILARMSTTKLSPKRYLMPAPELWQGRDPITGMVRRYIQYGHVIKARRLEKLKSLPKGLFTPSELEEISDAVGGGVRWRLSRTAENMRKALWKQPPKGVVVRNIGIEELHRRGFTEDVKGILLTQAEITSNLRVLSESFGRVGTSQLHLPYKPPTGKLREAVLSGIRATNYGVFVGVNEAMFAGGEVYWMFVEQGHEVLIPRPTKNGYKMHRTGTRVSGKFFMQEIYRRVESEVGPQIESLLASIGPLTERIIVETLGAGILPKAAGKVFGSTGKYGAVGQRSPLSPRYRVQRQDIGDEGFANIGAGVPTDVLGLESLAALAQAYREKYGTDPPKGWLQ